MTYTADDLIKFLQTVPANTPIAISSPYHMYDHVTKVELKEVSFDYISPKIPAIVFSKHT